MKMSLAEMRAFLRTNIRLSFLHVVFVFCFVSVWLVERLESEEERIRQKSILWEK